jgi:DNA-binding transcriptional MerR regulator
MVAKPKSTMRTGQLARAAQVSVETLRFYERLGLVPAPKRTQAGYRQYTTEHLVAVRFIKQAQRLGFSLREIARLASLRADSRKSRAEVRARTSAKLAEVEAEIADLTRVRAVLGRLLEECAGGKAAARCAILQALETEDIVPP